MMAMTMLSITIFGAIIIILFFILCCRHNTHHYLGFFRAIREAVKSGNFDQFRQQFIESRRDQVAVAAVHA